MKIAAYAALAVVAASAANAGGYVAPVVDTPIEIAAAPVVDVSDWTGFYAGLQYGKGNADFTLDGASAEDDLDAYGVHGGYLRDFGKFVAGGELAYDKADLDTGGDADLWRLRARAGYDMGRFLPYATLGAARISGDDVSETGMSYGLGADFKVTEKFTVGAEYSRNDFKDVDDVDGADLDTDLVQVRASYRF